MCCFSQPVESVANTRIFARLMGDKQAIVYQMRFKSQHENAMILPLPVRQDAGDKAVSFVSLKGYGGFFSDLNQAFPTVPPLPAGRLGVEGGVLKGPPPLVVHEVGDFIASYVPSVSDFSRLNPRFAIPKASWDQVGGYEDYGFAVFQLKSRSGETHPMAFTFESRWKDKIFFPTVHIHDGKVHAREYFDHSLYFQLPEDMTATVVAASREDQAMQDVMDHVLGRPPRWVSSRHKARFYCDIKAAKGFIHPDRPLHRISMVGSFNNEDVIIDHGAPKLGFYRGTQGPSVQNAGMATGVFAGFAWLMNRRMELADRNDARRFAEREKV